MFKFESYSIELSCEDDWVERVILEAKNQLEADELPKGEIDCENCRYIKKRSEAIKGH